jgi:MFS family permease
MRVLLALSFSHMLNDTIQSLIPAMYPVLKTSFALTFTQIGLITLTFQVTASLLQPVVGLYTDRRPKPFSLAVGMGFTLIGLLMLAHAGNLGMILVSAALVGAGSAVFHPEASRVAHMASGGRHGMAQSLFQVGGNFGSSLGPLLAAWIIVPRGQGSLAWFSVAAGTIAGGPIGDRLGRMVVIWVSILGVAPFTLLLPYANLFWTAVLTVIIGLVLASAFSAILVYAQELIPGKVGMVSGLFFGFAFGLGGIGAAVLGKLADATDIYHVYHLCSFLPLIGLLTVFLPDIERKARTALAA